MNDVTGSSKELDSPLTVAMGTLALAKRDEHDPEGSQCELSADESTAVWHEIERLQILEGEYATFRKCAAADVERLQRELNRVTRGDVSNIITTLGDALTQIGILEQRLRTAPEPAPALLGWQALKGCCQDLWKSDVTMVCTLPKGHAGDHRMGGSSCSWSGGESNSDRVAQLLRPTPPPLLVTSESVDYMQRYFFEVHGLKHSREDARVVLETALKQSTATKCEGQS